MATFLLKTEPSTFSYDNLVRDGRCTWDGVTNAQALIVIRSMKTGDEAFIYHTGDDKRIAGLARVTRGAYADPRRPAETRDGKPKFAVIDLAPLGGARSDRATLSAIKADPRFKDFLLVRNSRLSAMAVPPDLARVLRAMAGL